MKFQKGVVMNPEGRGARKPITDAMRAYLYRPEEDQISVREKRTIGQAIAIKICQQAYEGCKDSQKLVLERIEGKPIQQIANADDEEFKVRVHHTLDDKRIINRYIAEATNND